MVVRPQSFSLLKSHSLWYSVNLLAAGGFVSWSGASNAFLSQFHLQGVIAGFLIQGFVSLLVGLIIMEPCCLCFPNIPSSPRASWCRCCLQELCTRHSALSAPFSTSASIGSGLSSPSSPSAWSAAMSSTCKPECVHPSSRPFHSPCAGGLRDGQGASSITWQLDHIPALDHHHLDNVSQSPVNPPNKEDGQ